MADDVLCIFLQSCILWEFGNGFHGVDGFSFQKLVHYQKARLLSHQCKGIRKLVTTSCSHQTEIFPAKSMNLAPTLTEMMILMNTKQSRAQFSVKNTKLPRDQSPRANTDPAKEPLYFPLRFFFSRVGELLPSSKSCYPVSTGDDTPQITIASIHHRNWICIHLGTVSEIP